MALHPQEISSVTVRKIIDLSMQIKKIRMDFIFK
jgi:hypothetical protein